MRSSFPLTLISLALVLAACSTSQLSASPTARLVQDAAWDGQPVRTDEQGAIKVEITPLNLENPGETLDFSVSLETHSVDLSMDLAPLASLITDSGTVVQALAWDAPLGGHHVTGVLSFPTNADGAGFIDGAQSLTILLINVGAAERVFTWEH